MQAKKSRRRSGCFNCKVKPDGSIDWRRYNEALVVLRHDYPYFVQRTNDGRYMLANRNYSPVGDPQLDWVDYETHPNRVWIRSLTEEIAKELSVDGKGTLDSFYLYESAVEPWDSEEKFAAYKERYNRLMRLIEKEKGQSVTYL